MASNTDYLLAIEDLTVSFDGFKAVDSLNLYLDQNELRVIIGPNGAGKTTVLDLICGKTRATSGSVKFKNREMLGMAEHTIVRSGIGRKFQTPSIYENLTVYENLEVSFPRGRGVFGALTFKTTSEVEGRIQSVAETTFLQDYLHTEGAFLSHGQKQWLEIGMLLMQEPELMMLDEPVAGMSPAEREQTAELLKRISTDRSILVIEHDMEFVSRIAKKVTVLHLGKILAEGSMDEIHNNQMVQDVYLGH
jgi:urea transport system ATP-binding protein